MYGMITTTIHHLVFIEKVIIDNTLSAPHECIHICRYIASSSAFDHVPITIFWLLRMFRRLIRRDDVYALRSACDALCV